MRILIYSTSPIVHSGYGVAARHIGPLLRDAGHEVAYHAWNTGYGMQSFDGLPIYPKGNVTTSVDILADVVNHFNADVLLAICDPWIIHPPELWREGHDAKVVFWMPIQCAPIHPQIVNTMQIADACLVYSKFGTRVATEAGLDAVYMPLGVGPEYQPMDKAECRAMLGEVIGKDVSGRRIFGMVAANSSTMPKSRKAFDKVLMAFKTYQQVNGDGLLWLNVTDRTKMTGGVDLDEMAYTLGVKMDDDVFIPPTLAVKAGIPDKQMAMFYGAMDVALQATAAEGFGLPIIEAQACNTPVVVTNSSSQPELVRYGTCIDGQEFWVPGAPGGIAYEPDAKQLAQVMLHHDFGEPGDVSEQIHREYSWGKIAARLGRQMERVTT